MICKEMFRRFRNRQVERFSFYMGGGWGNYMAQKQWDLPIYNCLQGQDIYFTKMEN